MGADGVKTEGLRQQTAVEREMSRSIAQMVAPGLAPSDLDPSIKISVARGGQSLVTARVVVEGGLATATVEDHQLDVTYEVSVRAPQGGSALETAARVLHEAAQAGRL